MLRLCAVADCAVSWKNAHAKQASRHKEGCEDPAASSLQEGLCKFTFASKKKALLKHLASATVDSHKLAQNRCEAGWYANAAGYCEKQQPVATQWRSADRRDYNCPFGWHLGADGMCIFGEDFVQPQQSFACPDGYFLTQDNFCREVRFLPPPPPAYRICDSYGYCRQHLVRLGGMLRASSAK